MTILVFGRGQMAGFYLRHYEGQGAAVKIATKADITDVADVDRAIAAHKPSLVINTAAATNLEWCGENRLRAFEVNVLGAGNVARACDRHGIYLVHFSSGCVFSSTDGRDARLENDVPNPSSYYGWTKVWSENIVAFERSSSFKCLILRPRQPVSSAVDHKNMLVKMLTFSKFVDTPNSGTVIEDLMEWTDALIGAGATGVYHVANSGWTTPYQIGRMLREYILPSLEPERITKGELDQLTPNIRVDTVLDVSKLEALGIRVRPYEERLRETIRDLAFNIVNEKPEHLREELEKTAVASRQRTMLNDVYPSLYTAESARSRE